MIYAIMYLDACHYNFTIKSSYIHRLLIKTSSPFGLLTNNILITFDHPLCSLKHFLFLISLRLISANPSVSLCLKVLFPLGFSCFHSFKCLHFSLTLYLTSFHCHVSLCLTESFVHLQYTSFI